MFLIIRNEGRQKEITKPTQFSLCSKFPRMDLQAKQDPKVLTPGLPLWVQYELWYHLSRWH